MGLEHRAAEVTVECRSMRRRAFTVFSSRGLMGEATTVYMRGDTSSTERTTQTRSTLARAPVAGSGSHARPLILRKHPEVADAYRHRYQTERASLRPCQR
jgi:hypothetical protein